MRTADFDFELPPELIAQVPAANRDASRLLVLDRATGTVGHRQFPDLLNFLRAGDVLVLNNSKVVPARLRAMNPDTGGQFEILLLEENSRNDWWAMMRPGKRARIGSRIQVRMMGSSSKFQVPSSNITSVQASHAANVVSPAIMATVLDANAEGHRRLRFDGVENIFDWLDRLGEVPLPPYIRRAAPADDDRERYQTVYAETRGSVAAPTAGLHFTEPLLEQIKALGVEVCFVTLHVGLGTFAPVKSETIAEHTMHDERYDVSAATAAAVNRAKAEGRRVIAVGTTSVRVLESVAARQARPAIDRGQGRTRIFIYPPYDFKIVDGLLTNFHLPCSTLLMLVSAFAAPGGTQGRERVLDAYRAAIRERYRFFSYGDAMLLL
jgi:S-adenosylmethionine:tRNA ribosyltransferase-isomerase